MNTYIYKINNIISVILIFITSAIQDKWHGNIYEENGHNIIINTGQPIYGAISYELHEEMIFGKERNSSDYFGVIKDIDVDTNGTIYILDGNERAIRRIGSDGKYLKNIGRRGQGPGEFQTPKTIALFSKTGEIAVGDLFKITLFSKEGNYIDDIPVMRGIYELYPHEDGGFIAKTLNASSTGQPIESIEKITRNGEISFEVTPIRNETLNVTEGSNDAIVSVIPARTGYEPELITAAIDEKTFLVANSKNYQIAIIDASGMIIKTIRVNEEPIKISSMEKEKMSQTITNPDKRNVLEIPKYKPFFNNIVCDDNGRIYVQRTPFPYDNQNIYSYDVFDREGYLLFKLKMSLKINVIRNGYLYGTVRDSQTDNEYIKRCKILNWKSIPSNYSHQAKKS